MKDRQIGILLVEDDEVDVMNVQRAFSKCSITNPLHIANNGLEALAMLRADGPDRLRPFPKLVLLDINMPKMNGIEFLAQLRADPTLRTLSVIMLTTSNEERDKVAAYNLNVAGYIIKPVKLEDFMATMSALDGYWSLNELP